MTRSHWSPARNCRRRRRRHRTVSPPAAAAAGPHGRSRTARGEPDRGGGRRVQAATSPPALPRSRRRPRSRSFPVARRDDADQHVQRRDRGALAAGSVFTRRGLAAITPTVEYGGDAQSAYLGMYDSSGGSWRAGDRRCSAQAAGRHGTTSRTRRADGEFRIGPVPLKAGDPLGFEPGPARAGRPRSPATSEFRSADAEHVWLRLAKAYYGSDPSGRACRHADVPRPAWPARRADPRGTGRVGDAGGRARRLPLQPRRRRRRPRRQGDPPGAALRRARPGPGRRPQRLQRGRDARPQPRDRRVSDPVTFIPETNRIDRHRRARGVLRRAATST